MNVLGYYNKESRSISWFSWVILITPMRTHNSLLYHLPNVKLNFGSFSATLHFSYKYPLIVLCFFFVSTSIYVYVPLCKRRLFFGKQLFVSLRALLSTWGRTTLRHWTQFSDALGATPTDDQFFLFFLFLFYFLTLHSSWRWISNLGLTLIFESICLLSVAKQRVW